MNELNKLVRKEFASILADHKALRKHEQTEQYWPEADKVKRRLRTFLELDFRGLSSADWLKLCTLFSTHRPTELHSFFVKCSMLDDNPKPYEEKTARFFREGAKSFVRAWSKDKNQTLLALVCLSDRAKMREFTSHCKHSLGLSFTWEHADGKHTLYKEF